VGDVATRRVFLRLFVAISRFFILDSLFNIHLLTCACSQHCARHALYNDQPSGWVAIVEYVTCHGGQRAQKEISEQFFGRTK
jgi:hypothetical protein